MKLFRSETRYNLGYVDMVIVTHDHLDHCHDLASPISLLRQYNGWRVNTRKPPKPPKVWDMIVSYGVADMYASMLEHPDNAPCFFWRRGLPNSSERVEGRQDIPSFLVDARKRHLLSKVPYLRSFCEAVRRAVTNKYTYDLNVLPAYHKELLGAMTSFGVKIKLRGLQNTSAQVDKLNVDLPRSIVISGDTAINGSKSMSRTKGKELASFYEGAHLLILHVGGLEKQGHKRYSPGGHLGLQGTVEVLSRLETKPKLVVLTEWGYEFGRIGSSGRAAIVECIVKGLDREFQKKGKKNPYDAAVEVEGRPPQSTSDEGIPILPADIGLRVRLPDLHIACEKEGFVESDRVYAKEVLEEIEYHMIPSA